MLGQMASTLRAWAGFLLALGLLSCGSPAVETGKPAPPAAPPMPELMIVPPELKTPPSITVSQAAMDIVNEVGADKSSPAEFLFRAKTGSPLWFRGWAYDETHKSVPGTVWIELTNRQSAQRFFIPANRADGADVAAGFKLPWARQCRFSTPVISGHNIPRGKYGVKVYQILDGAAELTRWYPVPAVSLLVE